MKRALLLTLLGMVVLACALGAAFQLRFSPRVPAAAGFSAPSGLGEANRQDLVYLREAFPRIDRSSDRSIGPRDGRAAGASGGFQREVDALLARADHLTRGELAMGISHAVALSNNGHTALASTRLRHLPIRLHWFAEGLYVLQTSPEHLDLLGARVDRIGELTPDEAYARLRDSLPGIEGHRRARSVHFLDSPEALAGLHLIPSAATVPLELTSAAGVRISRSLDGGRGPVTPDAELDSRFRRMTGCEVSCNWPQAFDSGNQPLYLRHAEEGYFRNWLGDLDAVYVRLFSIDDAGPIQLDDFLAATLAEIRARRPRQAIVDLRGTPGGNYLKARSFAREIGAAVEGYVFVITDGGTFSAALVTAAYLKAASRGIIVGEHPGDFEQFWAEGGRSLTLPNSGLRIWMATGYHDWEHGCTSFARCFWPNVLFGVAAGKLDPALPVTQTFAAYRAGRDEALEQIAKMLQRGAAPPGTTKGL